MEQEHCNHNLLEVAPDDGEEMVEHGDNPEDFLMQCVQSFCKDMVAILETSSSTLKSLQQKQGDLAQELIQDINDAKLDLEDTITSHSKAVECIKDLRSCLVMEKH